MNRRKRRRTENSFGGNYEQNIMVMYENVIIKPITLYTTQQKEKNWWTKNDAFVPQ